MRVMLKRCPNCGGHPVLSYGRGGIYVECNRGCGTKINKCDTLDKAMDRWNSIKPYKEVKSEEH